MNNAYQTLKLFTTNKMFRLVFLVLSLFSLYLSSPARSETQNFTQLSHPADSFFCNKPLGAIYSPTATIFRVFAPTANRVTLNLYQVPKAGQAERFPMTKNSDGSWEVTVSKDCLDLYYTLTAAGDDPGFHPEQELIDPYAQAVTAYDGRAIVVNDDLQISPRPNFPANDAIIYEMHIRDFTIDADSGIQRRGKYLGLTEAGTHLFQRPEIATGLDHLSELGVNTVQLMPIMEFQSDENSDQYGWGYDSVHFNSPEGWYATTRYDASRVREVKMMIDALHKRGIRVIIDVVYNHTMENIKKRVYSFEGLVPGYYYRRKADGSYWDGSGVGNEFRSEAPMARRFLIDSVKYWVTKYGVDGFRFDLMGLIDLETMRQLTRELLQLDAKLIIYGEPWSAGDTPIKITNKGTQRSQGFSVFNDNFRDALKGSVFQPREQGYLQAGTNIDKIKIGIKGSIQDFTDQPGESLNYVECHDNHTFWDRLVISTIDDSRLTDADRRAMDRLGAAILFTSQGIPFFQSGQEFLRSKGGNENSYNQPDAVNMIRWKEKAANYDIYRYYQGLIKLRRAHNIFRLNNAAQIKAAIKFFDDDLNYQLPKGIIAYQISDVSNKDSWSRAILIFNATGKKEVVRIPAGQWRVFVDQFTAGNEPLSAILNSADNMIEITPRSALILGEMR